MSLSSVRSTTCRHEVSVATSRDLSAIYRWLRSAGERSGKGFLGNKRWIDAGLVSGEVTVVRDDGGPIAFLLASRHPEILCVKRSHWGRGIGRALFEDFLDRIRSRETIADLVVECVPRTSLPFWQSMGFERDSPERSFNLFARRLFPDQRELPAGSRTVRVTAEFSAVDYRGTRSVLRTQSVDASPEQDGSLSLGSTIIGPRRELWSAREDRLRIAINGRDAFVADGNLAHAERAGLTFRLGVACLDRIAPAA